MRGCTLLRVRAKGVTWAVLTAGLYISVHCIM